MYENYALEEKKTLNSKDVTVEKKEEASVLYEQIAHECELPDATVHHGFQEESEKV